MKQMELAFLAGVQVDEEIYFSAWNVNGLFKYNPSSKETFFLRCFPDEDAEYLHSEAILYQDTIWFIPSHSNRIAIVDLLTLEIEYLNLPSQGLGIELPNGVKPTIRMTSCYCNKEPYLWLIPTDYNLILYVDMNKRDIQIYEEVEVGSFSNALRIDNELWLCPKRSLEGMVIDTISRNHRKYEIGEKNKSYIKLIKWDDWLVHVPYFLKEGILLKNYKDNQIKIINFTEDEQTCNCACIIGDNLIMAPYNNNQLIRVNLRTEECIIEKCSKESLALISEKEMGVYIATMNYGNEEWLMSMAAKNPIIRFETNNVSYEHIMIECTIYGRFLLKKYQENNLSYIKLYDRFMKGRILNESMFSIDSLLYIIKNSSNSKEFNEKDDDNMLNGQKILKMTMK